jgi:hypothetical protein
MWTYSQQTGRLERDGVFVAHGYSGSGRGKNEPSLQNVADVGPIPQGRYTIGDPYDTDSHGPHVMRLTPDPADEIWGRAGFLIHGDSLAHPGSASHGCIVLPRAIRNEISDSKDKELTVTA